MVLRGLCGPENKIDLGHMEGGVLITVLSLFPLFFSMFFFLMLDHSWEYSGVTPCCVLGVHPGNAQRIMQCW